MKLSVIVEMLEKERVVRNGKWKIKYTTNKEGYKIVNDDGHRTEVKMSYAEIRRRRLAGKRAARKRKGKMAKINAKRKRSMAKR
jgi:hypothetical protein